MLNLLAQVVGHHYGFLGIEGIFGVLVGLIIFLFIAVILYKICLLLLAELGMPAAWINILTLLFLLVILIVFLHFFGLY
jgi:hypothetical protein